MPGEGGRSTPPESGDILKHVSLTLQESGATRSTTAAEEFAIGEATVFVYQSGPSGEVLYKTVQTESSTVGVDLLFTDAVDYTYRFEAYANMGELTEAPSEVSFEDESSEGFQMRGSLSGVDASSAGSATVMLDRYVGRVVVGSVKLQWKDQSNASQEFTLKRMWVANAAGVTGGGAAYNVGGAYSVSVMDALLVSEVNQVIADGGTYEIPHYLYAYASGSTALVLECEWAGQTMYYHVDYEPVANSSMTYSLSIHQTGSPEPLGDVTDDALVAAGLMEANDWNATDSENAFGEAPPEATYLYIEALQDNTEVKFSTNPIQYSLDGMSWIDLPAGTYTPVINTGERVYFRAEGLTPTSSSGIGTFSVNRKFNVGGNIMSMLFGDDFVGKTDLTGYDYGFKNLFKKNSYLISAKELVLPATTLAKCCYSSIFATCTLLEEAPELPATTLVEECYSYMFQTCSSLKSAPELPATDLADYCYWGMFSGTWLLEAPELPAITLATGCYQAMFNSVEHLTEAPELPATTLAQYCYSSMFSGCVSLIEAPELPATTLDYYCYNGMFKGCISLVNAPDLPATKLVQSCYDSMFDGCSSLSYIKMLATDISATGCLNNWVSGVSATGTFVKSADATWDVAGVSGVPEGWNVEVDTPVGAYVYDVNGNFYTASEWTASGNDNSTAVGVAVSDGEHSFVIHPTESSNKPWSSNTSVLVDGVFTTEDRATAETDFAGEANTAAILAAVSAGTIPDAPAASYCDGVEFAHGKKGYLPAAGEITLCYTYLSTINECMSAIGGTTFDMAGKYYWTSTQFSAIFAWIWFYNNLYVSGNGKGYTTIYARAFSAL